VQKLSLICVNCGKIIVMSDTQDHLAGCSSCDISEEQGKKILESSKAFSEWARSQRK
jgi:DNA-directed RNA polymerase subunit M/transcription elongation factor TFIIS